MIRSKLIMNMQYIGGSLSFNRGLSINPNKIMCVRRGVHLYSTKKKIINDLKIA